MFISTLTQRFFIRSFCGFVVSKGILYSAILQVPSISIAVLENCIVFCSDCEESSGTVAQTFFIHSFFQSIFILFCFCFYFFFMFFFSIHIFLFFPPVFASLSLFLSFLLSHIHRELSIAAKSIIKRLTCTGSLKLNLYCYATCIVNL